MLAVGFSQMSFIRGRKIPSISSFMRVFIMNGFWILSCGWFFIYDHVIFSPFVLLMWLSSVAQLCLTLCNPMDCSTYTRPPCPLSTPGVYSNSCSLSWWCHPTISSSVIPFSCFPSFPASGSLPMSQFFIRWTKYWSFSFSISPSNEYSGLISLGWTGWISLLSKGPSRVFFNFTLPKHQFSHSQLSL